MADGVGRGYLASVFQAGQPRLNAADEHLTIQVVIEPINAPWWQWFPFDFITEVLLPFPIEDRRLLKYTLRPFPKDDFEAVKRRAEEAKKKAHED